MRRTSHAKTVLLSFMTAFVILPLCIFIVYSCIDMQKRVSDNAIENNLSYAQQIANNVNQMVKLSNYLTSSLMMDSDVLMSLRSLQNDQDSYEQYIIRSRLTEKLAVAESTIMNAAGGKLLLVAATGHVISSSNRIAPEDFDQQSEWIQSASQSSRVTLFDSRLEELFLQVQLGTTLHPNKHLYFRRSIISYSGQFLGMIAVQLGTEGMWDREHTRFADMRHSNLLVLDREGTLHLAQSGNEEQAALLRTLPQLQSLTSGQTANGQINGLYYHAVGLDSDQLVLFLVQPTSSLFAISHHIVQNMLYLACLLAFISIISMAYISHYITQPIAALVQNLEEQAVDTLHVELEKTRFQEMENLVVSYNRAGKRIAELIQQVRTESFLREKVNYEMLISQISPHFICNTVNAIKITAQASSDERTVEALTALGDILHSVYGRRMDVVSVGREMQLLTSYVKIMRLRFDIAFQYVDAVPTELYRFEVPAFSLQPIVENAVLHGVRGIETGQIIVSALESENDIIFFVFNNGETPDPEIINRQLNGQPRDKHKITGIGLHNVHTRIRLLYGPPYGLSLNTAVTVGCEIRLQIPRKEAEDDDD